MDDDKIVLEPFINTKKVTDNPVYIENKCVKCNKPIASNSLTLCNAHYNKRWE